MASAQIIRNPFMREAETLRRAERQMARETVMFRSILVFLAVVGAWLIWLRNSYAGEEAFGTDALLIAIYWGFIAIKWRDDARS